jgi:uncharacterized FlaG/YvyC family protein
VVVTTSCALAANNTTQQPKKEKEGRKEKVQSVSEQLNQQQRHTHTLILFRLSKQRMNSMIFVSN